MTVPWYLIIAFKLFLKRLHITTNIWRSLGIFKHGGMHSPGYAIDVVRSHYEAVEDFLPEEFSVVELGPGDSVSSAFILHSLGAKKSYLIDVDSCAVDNVSRYKELLLYMVKHNYGVDKKLFTCTNLSTMMSYIDCNYLTHGLKDLKEIATSSVDFMFSHAVLQHVFLDEIEQYVDEMYRILKKNGVMSHRIDFRDCIAANLNNLRFNEYIWESRWFRSSGFYTNRLRYRQIMEIFSRAGFACESISLVEWDTLPIEVNKLSKKFRARDDLLVSTIDVVLRKL